MNLYPIVVLSFLLISSLGCGRGQPLNVLFIVVDTLRRDHLGCHGYDRDTSPSIDTLASEAVLFERAYSAAPWTKPSVASMITGLYPTSHTAGTPKSVIPQAIDTLAEILQGNGYQTGGVVSHLYISALLGFGQGYDQYSEREARGRNYVSTNAVTSQAIELLESMASTGRPFLLFVHYFDPHYNYRRHPEFDFAPEAAGRLTGTESIQKLRALSKTLTPEEIDFLRALYDEEIAFTDAGIGRLLSRLRELHLYEKTLIVFTSDHGEEFLEHGWLGHTRTVYEELVHVPLIIRLPGAKSQGQLVSTPVSLVSLTPTILDILDIDTTDLTFQEPSLEPYLTDHLRRGPEAVFTEVDFRDPKGRKTAFKKAIITPRFKLIRDDQSGNEELYDLIEDSNESHNLAAERPALSQKLRAILDRRIRSLKEKAYDSAEIEFSEDEIETLRGLGYIGP